MRASRSACRASASPSARRNRRYAYANERKQGRAGANGSAPIIAHADVRRMLLTMRALTRAARAICYATGGRDRPRAARQGRGGAQGRDQRASLLTPVAKAFSTDIGIEVASLGVQVHGGMGYIEETGAAQHYRDARIAQIYEGTNGIQAIDLVTRKLPMMRRRRDARLSRRIAPHRRGRAGDERSGVRRDRRAAWRGGRQPRPRHRMAARRARQVARCGARRRDAVSAAVRVTRRAAACWPRTRSPQAAAATAATAGRVALARFFAENIAVQAGGLETTVTEGADSVSHTALPARPEEQHDQHVIVNDEGADPPHPHEPAGQEERADRRDV